MPDSAYQGNDPNQPAQESGEMLFAVDDEGKIVYARVLGLNAVKKETPFIGTIVPWEQAVKAAIMRNPNFMAGEGEAYWRKCRKEGYSYEGMHTVLAVSPACYIHGKQSAPAWCVTIQLAYAFNPDWHFTYDMYVDAVTGELLHSI